MNRTIPSSLRVLPLPLALALVGCGTGVIEAPVKIVKYPEVQLSSEQVDFGTLDFGESATRTVILRNTGDVDLGIASISLRDEMFLESFTLSWNINDVVCSGPQVDEDGGEGSTNARLVTDDTAGGSSGSSGSGSSGDDGSSSDDGGGSDGGGSGSNASNDNTPRLPPDCEIPLTIGYVPTDTGIAWGSVEILTVSQEVGEGEEPAYYRDPDEFRHTILMRGEAIQGKGNMVVRSPTIDLGHHYPGEESQEFVYIHNLGDGILKVNFPEIKPPPPPDPGEEPPEENPYCDVAYSIDTSYMTNRELLPGEATFFKVLFNPVDLDPAFCTILVSSDDEDTPEAEVNAKGNIGFDPENVAPEVAVRYPPVGYQHRSADPLVVEVDMFDKNQPANTLVCKIRSHVGETKIADCRPDDISGHVYVEIPIDLLAEGTDTLLVQVTDQSELIGRASTTVLWRSLYPPSDDDGDGWGSEMDAAGNVDCDDANITVYPGAAELPDGLDNDCDGAIDENSLGGDDDGDSVTEVEGDCDDFDPETYPGAMEIADQKDNDCDGKVDEGTSFVDDDGDGFSELDLDCDDDDPNTNPAAIEYCDGRDNNCNFIQDDAEPGGCIETASRPAIFGGIQMNQTAIGAGESTTMTVFVYEKDGQTLSFDWSQQDSKLDELGHVAVSSPTAQTITWTAPQIDPEGDGYIFTVMVIVEDEDGNATWVDDKIWVFPQPVELEFERVMTDQATETGGCGGSSSSTSTAGLLVPLLSFLGITALARRRRDD